MSRKKYATAEEITEGFRASGWSINTLFTELTLAEAREKGYLFAVYGVLKGRKYFKMNNGNIYDDSGKIAMFNI